MSFVRSKEIPSGSGNWYDYEVETVHVDGKVRQKHIQYLGKRGGHHKPLIGSRPHFDLRGGTALSNASIPSKLKVACKFCGSQNTYKYGKYKDVQSYFCKDCETKFTGTDALAHGKVSPSYIANALNDFYDGMSFHDIEHKIEGTTVEGISHPAIIKWVNKFTNQAIKETKDYHPKVGDTWIADETYVRVDKSKANVDNPYSKSRKAKWVIFWDIIDADTRYLLASHVTTTRSKADARAIMEKAAKCAGKHPKVVITDRLNSYLDGIELAYGSDTEHRQGEPFDIENNTNLIERFHGSLKDRTKVMRGLKNLATAKYFTDGWLVHYNYFRPHMALDNKRPAEVAGIEYDTKSWADVVGYEKQPIVQTLQPEPV